MAMAMSAAEAHATAAAEGLALVRAETATGFKGVSYEHRGRSKPFQARLWEGGQAKTLGSFATAEEAALAIARILGPAGVVASLAAAATAALEPAPMTAAEAHAAAAAAGLALVRAENATGFKGVTRNDRYSKPFQAQVRHGGHKKHLGAFTTAEEAALAIARFLAPPAAEAAPAAPPVAPPAPPAPAAVPPPAADAAPPDTSGVEVTGEVRRADVQRRKRKRAIDVDAFEVKVEVEVKPEPL